ncbi:BrnA antitoxin family protein [Bosea sp. LjRoot237]|uniref:BrnA antitoxin family protein n=1 Tax=Bosea sp. LjRoot237 TaxID=3342292 RepID=UPI003ECD80CC
MPKLQKEFVPGQGYSKEDWDAVSDNPEWTKEDFRRARPFSDVFPDLAATFREEVRKRGPIRTKEAISIRLDMDLVEKLRATGPGWQSRVNDALREWLKKNAA